MRLLSAGLVTLALATAIHLDWHVARPAAHHLSLGWPWHWVLALPTFGAVALYVARVRSQRPVAMSIAIIGIAALLGGVVEPAWEFWLGGASGEWAFGRARNQAFLAFLGAGLVTYAGVYALVQRRASLR